MFLWNTQKPCINVYIVYDCTGCIDHAASMLRDDWAALYRFIFFSVTSLNCIFII